MQEIMLTISQQSEDAIIKGEVNKMIFNNAPSKIPFKIYFCRRYRYEPNVVIGECVCDKVHGFISKNVAFAFENADFMSLDYAKDDGNVYMWEIRDIEIYTEPKRQSEYRRKRDNNRMIDAPATWAYLADSNK